MSASNAGRHKVLCRWGCTLTGLGALLTGCSGYQMRHLEDASLPAASRPSADAMICVLRPHGLGHSVVAPVTDNGALVGATEGASYFCYGAEPGRHRIVSGDAEPVVLDAESGRTYYIAHELKVARDELLRITPESAGQLSGWCRQLEMRTAPQGILVPERGAIARAEPARDTAPERSVVAALPKKPETSQTGAEARLTGAEPTERAGDEAAR